METTENEAPNQGKKSSLKLIFFIAILALFFILVKFTPLSEYANLETLKNSRNQLRSLATNWWFPLAFIAAYVGGVIICFPGLILGAGGAIIFGTLNGTILNVIASNIGVNIAFFISRNLGRDFVEKLMKGKMKTIDDKIEENGFMAILRLRLIPVVPFNVFNYAAGLSKVKYKDYALGSLIGMFPGTFIYTFFADAILIDGSKKSEAFVKLLIAAGLLISLSFVPNLIKKFSKSSYKTKAES